VKDTEKEDELKAMVNAWETDQPGRSKKVYWIMTISNLDILLGIGISSQIPLSVQTTRW